MKSKDYILAAEWIEKADKDLEVSEILLKKRSRYLDFACFHCQQAFEKYLKALLIYNKVFPPRTHILEDLLEKTFKYNLGLLKFVDVAKEISPFAVIPRYPDEILDITIPKLRSLIKKTKGLANLIKDLVN